MCSGEFGLQEGYLHKLKRIPCQLEKSFHRFRNGLAFKIELSICACAHLRYFSISFACLLQRNVWTLKPLMKYFINPDL